MITSEVGYLSDEELKKVQEQLDKKFFFSNLNVFNDHNGLRPGELHLVIAPPGGGKSSFIRTVVFQLLTASKVFLYLSEETREKYVQGLNTAFQKAVQDSPKGDRSKFMNNLRVMSEVGIDEFAKKNFFNILKDELLDSESQVFIFDNLTTSFLANVGIGKEAQVIQWFKTLAKELNIPVILVIHTQKGTTLAKGAYSSENVRGNATSSLMGSYVYVLMIVHAGSNTRSFVLTDKARYHTKANKRVYEMKFDDELGMIVSDMKSNQVNLAQAINEAQASLRPKREKKNGW